VVILVTGAELVIEARVVVVLASDATVDLDGKIVAEDNGDMTDLDGSTVVIVVVDLDVIDAEGLFVGVLSSGVCIVVEFICVMEVTVDGAAVVLASTVVVVPPGGAVENWPTAVAF
jgi:hypothetical protein